MAHTTEGATALSTKAKVAKPQSAPAMTRSRPTTLAKLAMRWAISRGCSTKLVVESMTSGDQHFVIRDLGVAQILPFMGVAGIGGLERQPRRPRLYRHLENLGERDVVGVRPLVIAPAQMHAHRVGRNIRGGVVERRDVALCNAQEFVIRQVLVLVVPSRAEIRRIDLQDKSCLMDRLVFFLQRIGQRRDIGIFVLVVRSGTNLVSTPGDAAFINASTGFSAAQAAARLAMSTSRGRRSP